MSPDNSAVPGADGGVPAWEQMMRAMLGDGADEAIRELQERGFDPAAMAAASGLPDDPAALQQVFAQVQALLSASGDDPVNWQMAHDLARQQAAAGGDPSLTAAQTQQVLDALAVAELWLDAATDLPPSTGAAHAWSRAEWVEATLPTWRTLTEPVASSLSIALVGALGGALSDESDEQLALPGGSSPASCCASSGPPCSACRSARPPGTLAHEVFGTTDIGLPLLDRPAPALVAANVDAFAEGLDAPADEVRLFLALREAAATRLFTHVPWLRVAPAGHGRDLRARHHHRRRPARGGRPLDRRHRHRGPAAGAVRRRLRAAHHARTRSPRSSGSRRRSRSSRAGSTRSPPTPRSPTCRTPWRCAR